MPGWAKSVSASLPFCFKVALERLTVVLIVLKWPACSLLCYQISLNQPLQLHLKLAWLSHLRDFCSVVIQAWRLRKRCQIISTQLMSQFFQSWREQFADNREDVLCSALLWLLQAWARMSRHSRLVRGSEQVCLEGGNLWFLLFKYSLGGGRGVTQRLIPSVYLFCASSGKCLQSAPLLTKEFKRCPHDFALLTISVIHQVSH